MLLQTVKFETTLSEEEVLSRADARADAYRAVPGLLQKYYVKLDEPNHYCGMLLWESEEAMGAFCETELFKTVPATYGVQEAPSVEVTRVFQVLRNAG